MPSEPRADLSGGREHPINRNEGVIGARGPPNLDVIPVARTAPEPHLGPFWYTTPERPNPRNHQPPGPVFIFLYLEFRAQFYENHGWTQSDGVSEYDIWFEYRLCKSMPTQIIVADGKFAAQIKKSPETKTVLTVGVWPTQWYRQALEGDLSQWLLNISEIPSVNVQICVVSQSPDHISLAERKLQESISKSPPPEYQWRSPQYRIPHHLTEDEHRDRGVGSSGRTTENLPIAATGRLDLNLPRSPPDDHALTEHDSSHTENPPRYVLPQAPESRSTLTGTGWKSLQRRIKSVLNLNGCSETDLHNLSKPEYPKGFWSIEKGIPDTIVCFKDLYAAFRLQLYKEAQATGVQNARRPAVNDEMRFMYRISNDAHNAVTEVILQDPYNEMEINRAKITITIRADKAGNNYPDAYQWKRLDLNAKIESDYHNFPRWSLGLPKQQKKFRNIEVRIVRQLEDFQRLENEGLQKKGMAYTPWIMTRWFREDNEKVEIGYDYVGSLGTRPTVLLSRANLARYKDRRGVVHQHALALLPDAF